MAIISSTSRPAVKLQSLFNLFNCSADLLVQVECPDPNYRRCDGNSYEERKCNDQVSHLIY